MDKPPFLERQNWIWGILAGIVTVASGIAVLFAGFFQKGTEPPSPAPQVSDLPSPPSAPITSDPNLFPVPRSLLDHWASMLRSRGVTGPQQDAAVSNLAAAYSGVQAELGNKATGDPAYVPVLHFLSAGNVQRAAAELDSLPNAGREAFVVRSLRDVPEQYIFHSTPTAPSTASVGCEPAAGERWDVVSTAMNANSSRARFQSVLELRQGDCVRVRVLGTATRLLVSFAPSSMPDKAWINVATPVKPIPSDRAVVFRLDATYGPVASLFVLGSKSGGSNEWDAFATDGPAPISSVEHLARKR